MNDEMYSQEELVAFQRVGEFLCWFSMLETKMDESIIELLGLERSAGQLLLTYVPFGKKCEFLSELIGLNEVGFGEPDKKAARKRLEQIRAKADKRNIIAHSFFAAEGEAVKFMKAKKKLRADTSETIDQDAFEKHRADMSDLWGWLAQITYQIRKKMSEKQIANALLEQLEREVREPFSKLN
jgi:hypothetical protein